MKFISFVATDNIVKPGLLRNNRVYDLTEATGLPSLLAMIAAGYAVARLNDAALGEGLPMEAVRIVAPLQRPPRIFAIGLNYADHAAESNMKVQTAPTVFMKLSSSVCGPGDDVILPKNSSEPDYEAELAVVVGKAGYRVPRDEWQDHVFGYTIVNDVSARDIQLATSQWTLGKSFPTFAPMGPSIVTVDEIGDPHALNIDLRINGEMLQSSNTRDLIFKVPELIEHISSLTPLEPGDIISTGTPAGVGLGRNPKRWLKDGEEMVVTVEKIGELRNCTRQEI